MSTLSFLKAFVFQMTIAIFVYVVRVSKIFVGDIQE
jgi:hypothetical protein